MADRVIGVLRCGWFGIGDGCGLWSGIPYAVSCRALGVSPAWLYKWLPGDTSLRRARRQALTTLVIALFRRHKGRYGSPRITDDLRAMGWRVSVNTIAAIMAEQRLVARPKRRRRNLTQPGQVRAQGAGPAQPGLQPATRAERRVGR
ncbi:IS3 family transposase [Actinoplanes sp. NBC_00393]|uniref:IS3 family transposase n=1 Tax=Actinoplanes sp. NBC_00393 TaxID=2975953 RepID=UPI002E2360C2